MLGRLPHSHRKHRTNHHNNSPHQISFPNSPIFLLRSHFCHPHLLTSSSHFCQTRRRHRHPRRRRRHHTRRCRHHRTKPPKPSLLSSHPRCHGATHRSTDRRCHPPCRLQPLLHDRRNNHNKADLLMH